VPENEAPPLYTLLNVCGDGNVVEINDIIEESKMDTEVENEFENEVENKVENKV
jgi:hypothetical protein